MSDINQAYRFYPKNPGKYGLLKINKTKRMVAERCRIVIESIPKRFSEIDIPAKASDSQPIPSLRRISIGQKIPIGSNKAGKILFEHLTEPIVRLSEEKCVENVTADLTRILLALKCFKLDNGDLPETLDALVPAYLDIVPMDDFDGKPMKYSKKEKIVYSVGPDIKDSGGKKETKNEVLFGDNEYIHDDEAYRIDF